MDFQKSLKKQLAQDKIRDVLDKLHYVLVNTDKYNEYVGLSSSFANINEQIRRDVISESEARIAKNRLRRSILMLIDEVATVIKSENNSQNIYEEIIHTAEEAFGLMYTIVKVNQKILGPIFKTNYNLETIFNKISELVNQPQNRATFSRYVAFFRERGQSLEDNQKDKLARIVWGMVTYIDAFKQSVYDRSMPDLGKVRVYYALQEMLTKADIVNLRNIATCYLNGLQCALDELGQYIEIFKFQSRQHG